VQQAPSIEAARELIRQPPLVIAVTAVTAAARS